MCEFHAEEHDKLIRNRLVIIISDPVLREQLLRVQDLTLVKAIQLSKAFEISKREAQSMSATLSSQAPVTVDAVGKYQQSNKAVADRNSRSCYHCGLRYSPTHKCPAMGKKCNVYGGLNHFG